MKIKHSLFTLIMMSMIWWSCSGIDNPFEPATEVSISNNSFSPFSLTITAGTTVRWTNEDNRPHTVDSGTEGEPTQLFNLTLPGNGTTDEHKFNNTGSFSYYCGIHGEIGLVSVN